MRAAASVDSTSPGLERWKLGQPSEEERAAKHRWLMEAEPRMRKQFKAQWWASRNKRRTKRKAAVLKNAASWPRRRQDPPSAIMIQGRPSTNMEEWNRSRYHFGSFRSADLASKI